MTKYGGFDNYLLKTSDDLLANPKAIAIKRELHRLRCMDGQLKKQLKSSKTQDFNSSEESPEKHADIPPPSL